MSEEEAIRYAKRFFNFREDEAYESVDDVIADARERLTLSDFDHYSGRLLVRLTRRGY
jgi:hypothetical protein